MSEHIEEKPLAFKVRVELSDGSDERLAVRYLTRSLETKPSLDLHPPE